MVWEVFPRWKRVHRRPSMEQEVLLFQKMRYGRRKQSDECRRGRRQYELCSKSGTVYQRPHHLGRYYYGNLNHHRDFRLIFYARFYAHNYTIIIFLIHSVLQFLCKDCITVNRIIWRILKTNPP